MKSLIISLLVIVNSYAAFGEDICRKTMIDSKEQVVCFPEGKVCKYFNFHDMAPTLTYDCWSDISGDRNAANRIGCSNGQEKWPSCAGVYRLD